MTKIAVCIGRLADSPGRTPLSHRLEGVDELVDVMIAGCHCARCARVLETRLASRHGR